MTDNQLSLELLLKRENSILIVIDFQTKLADVMNEKEKTEDKISRLIQIASILKTPVLITQQYTKGLGQTTEKLINVTDNFDPIEKQTFSCFKEPKFMKALKLYPDRRQLVITGIESHVCVLQTVLEGKELGYYPFVVADGVTSRNLSDYKFALNRMNSAKVPVVTYEMIAFEWLTRAGTTEFKEVQKYIL